MGTSCERKWSFGKLVTSATAVVAAFCVRDACVS